LSNKRYAKIIQEIVQPQFLPKLFTWVETISEQNKKGLNVIKTVVDLRGTKRFKKSVSGAEDIGGGLDVDFSSGNVDAKAIFRKITTTTSYSKTFGEKPKAKEDYNILTKKKFSELQISQILKPDVIRILSKWLMINDQDKFTGRIYFTVREMFTVVKNQMSELPTSHDIFST